MHRSLSVREKRRWDSNRQLTTPTEGMAADFGSPVVPEVLMMTSTSSGRHRYP